VGQQFILVHNVGTCIFTFIKQLFVMLIHCNHSSLVHFFLPNLVPVFEISMSFVHVLEILDPQHRNNEGHELSLAYCPNNQIQCMKCMC
jgi:hypothetical protein